MATKENIKQLYTEDGKTKIYPVVISDSLTTDDGNTTGADAIGKWLAGAHIYAKNLTVSADPSVMNSTDRLARYNFVETKGNASDQTMTINMPLTIGVTAENGGNKNGNITINNDTTSIYSYSGVSFRGNKTEMNLSDVSNGWKGSTFTKQSGLIINSKNTNNAPSLVIGNRDIFTIDVNGGVGLFGDGWFNADANYEPAGKALCLQDKGGDVKIGGNLLVNGNEKINGKVKICDKHAYFSIFADGTINKNKITMQMNGEDAVVMSNYGGPVLDIKRTLLAENMAYLSDGGESIVSLAASSYAKIDYINLGGTSNSKINDTSNWSNIKPGGEIIKPMMKAASITRPGGSLPGVGDSTNPYHLLIVDRNYTFSTAGKTWDSSGIVSSENYIVAIDKNKEITPLYLNYPTNDVHGGVSVYDLSVENDLSVKNAFYLGDEDVKLYKNGTNLNIDTYSSTDMTFNVISSDLDDVDNSAFKVKCRLASERDTADALKLRIGTTTASFRDAVRAEVNDVHDVYLGVPVGAVVSWYNEKNIPKHWERWNDKRIYYVGQRRPNETPGYRCLKYKGDVSVTVSDKPMWKRNYESPSGNDFDKVTYRIEDYGYNDTKKYEWCFYVYPEINNTYKFWDTFRDICQQYVNIYIKNQFTNNRMCYDKTDMRDPKYEVMDNDNILIKYDLRDIYPIKIIKVE